MVLLDIRLHLASCRRMKPLTVEDVSGLVVVEKDDMLVGGIGDKVCDAISRLRKLFKFGEWAELMTNATEYL